MALMILEECTSCGACEVDCPNEAISEGDQHYMIDPDRCTECVGFHDEPQCASTCPVECIVPDPAHRETQEQLLAKKVRLHG
jgi:ferredoxin